MKKLKLSDGELKVNVEKEYLESLASSSQVSYNLNDVKLYSSNYITNSTYSKNLAYIIELWANIEPSSDMDKTKNMDETKKKMEEFERLWIENLLNQIERKKVLMDPIKCEEYFKLLEFLVKSGIIYEKELTTNKKKLIKV